MGCLEVYSIRIMMSPRLTHRAFPQDSTFPYFPSCKEDNGVDYACLKILSSS